MYRSPIPSTGVVEYDPLFYKFSNDRFMSAVTSGPDILGHFLEHPERFHVADSWWGHLEWMREASFVMVDGKIVKNRWGPID